MALTVLDPCEPSCLQNGILLTFDLGFATVARAKRSASPRSTGDNVSYHYTSPVNEHGQSAKGYYARHRRKGDYQITLQRNVLYKTRWPVRIEFFSFSNFLAFLCFRFPRIAWNFCPKILSVQQYCPLPKPTSKNYSHRSNPGELVFLLEFPTFKTEGRKTSYFHSNKYIIEHLKVLQRHF